MKLHRVIVGARVKRPCDKIIGDKIGTIYKIRKVNDQQVYFWIEWDNGFKYFNEHPWVNHDNFELVANADPYLVCKKVK